MEIAKIVARANELSGLMSHGQACFLACREMGVSESEVPTLASIVSAELTNQEINLSARVAEAAGKAIAERQKAHQLACEVVGEWAKKNNRTGKAGRMARKCRIDRLVRDCRTREEMESALS